MVKKRKRVKGGKRGRVKAGKRGRVKAGKMRGGVGLD